MASSIEQPITQFFNCKKPRRSKRLEYKEVQQMRYELVRLGNMGFFELLPTEMHFRLMSCLDADALGVFSSTSRDVCGVVDNYMESTAGYKRIFPLTGIHEEMTLMKHGYCMQQGYHLALYKKRSTSLNTAKERINMIVQMMGDHLCLETNCTHFPDCVAMSCFGKFINTFITGWASVERAKVYEAVTSAAKAAKLVEPVCGFIPGARAIDEMHLRLFFRRVFLNQSDTRIERTFWLKQMLRPLPLVHQARMLLVLFSSLQSKAIEWNYFCELVPTTKQQAFSRFSDLAHTLHLLYNNPRDWSHDDVISIFEEIINIPSGWLVENVATLLYFCGSTFTLQILTSRAINGRIQELATLLVYYSSVSIRIEHNVRMVLHLMSDLCSTFNSARDRQQLFFAVTDMFQEALVDIHEFGDPTANFELRSMAQAQAEFSKELVRLAFEKSAYLPRLTIEN